MALATVQDYITAARTLLQDEVVPYRYKDTELAEALGFALLDARKMRPDLFLDTNGTVANVGRATALNTAITMEPMYQRSLVYAIVGNAFLRDEEEASQAQAAGFMNHFVANLLTVQG
jgi:hypothetical protein